MRVKSLFYKKIKCGVNNCGSNFKLKKERGVNRYICSFYDNGKGCQRTAIDETRIVNALNRRFDKELTEEEIREVVIEVIVRSERLFDIVLKEGRPISYHERGIIF